MNTKIHKKRFEKYTSLELFNEWCLSNRDKNYNKEDKARLIKIIEKRAEETEKELSECARAKDVL